MFSVDKNQVVIFGVILPFYKGQNGSKFSQNRSGQAGYLRAYREILSLDPKHSLGNVLNNLISVDPRAIFPNKQC